MNRYQQNGITLINGDSLLILPTLAADSVDAVVTDPPYSSGGQSVASKKVAPQQKYQSALRRAYPELLGDNRDQRTLLIWATMWLIECLRIAKSGAPLLLFSDWRQIPVFSDAIQIAGWVWRGLVVWDKTESARPQIGNYRNQGEFVLMATKNKWNPLTSNYLPGVFRHRVNPQ